MQPEAPATVDRAPTPPIPDGSLYARQVQQLADALFPGNAGAELRVIVGGREAVIPGLATGELGLTLLEQEILQVMEESGPGARLAGSAIAKLVGCEYDSTFRSALSALRKIKRIRNHSPGYSLPE